MQNAANIYAVIDTNVVVSSLFSLDAVILVSILSARM